MLEGEKAQRTETARRQKELCCKLDSCVNEPERKDLESSVTLVNEQLEKQSQEVNL